MREADRLGALYREVETLAALIGAPIDGLPQPGNAYRDECVWFEALPDPRRYRLLYMERGEVRVVQESSDPDTVLRAAFSSVTQTMATEFELRHRRKGEDSRRQWMPIQEDLMGRLKPEWGERQRRYHAQVLERHPFDDTTG